jgi:hypothetical protein
LVIEISIGKRKLRFVLGDITERIVDAIVNAANSFQHFKKEFNYAKDGQEK